MKIEDQRYNIINEVGSYATEIAGRTCYKSVPGTDTSMAFQRKMISLGHLSMLEFNTVYLREVDIEDTGKFLLDKYENNRYSQTVKKGPVKYVTTNYRVIIENNWLDDYTNFRTQYPSSDHARKFTVKFITSRAIANELVRHRNFSFAQESTRYCNYSMNKFDNEITFIMPGCVELPPDLLDDKNHFNMSKFNRLTSCDPIVKGLIDSFYNSEKTYMDLINCQMRAQDARAVLPLATKTEIVMCGFASDWEKFFKLRDDSHAHPDMVALVHPLHADMQRMGVK